MSILGSAFWVGLLLAFATPPAYATDPEEMLGISFDFDKQEVTIQVSSHMCTQKGHFGFEMKGSDLTIARKIRDECKAMAEKVSLTCSLNDAGIDPNKPFKITTYP